MSWDEAERILSAPQPVVWPELRQTRRCPDCHGAQEVHVGPTWPKWANLGWATCPTCGGSGFLPVAAK